MALLLIFYSIFVTILLWTMTLLYVMKIPAKNETKGKIISKKVDDIKNHTPIPDVLIDYIKQNNWKILEMCAGLGENYRSLRDNNIDIISYDIVKNDNVSYARCGTIEDKYPDRALMACSGVEVKASINKYLDGKPENPIVILGGYARSVKLSTEKIDLIYGNDDLTNITYTANTIAKQKKYADNIIYQLDIRPRSHWMRNNDWELIESFLSPSGSSDWDVSHIFQIWKK